MLAKKLIVGIGTLVLLATFSGRVRAESPGLRSLNNVALEIIVVEDKDSKRVGLKKADIEAKVAKDLQDAGFALSSGEDYPRLEVTVSVMKPFAGFVVSHRFRVRDWVIATRNEKLRFTATVWEKSGLFSTTKKDLPAKLTDSLRTSTAAFVEEYRRENPLH